MLARPVPKDGSFYKATEVINAEEARSDIRSTTRSGYSAFDSQPGIQALLDSIGSYKTLYLPPNGVFNLNGKMITTKAEGQSIMSLGRGAELTGGGIEVANKLVTLGNLRLTGASAYGINLTDASFFLPGAWGEGRATQFYAENVFIYDKTYGIYNAVSQIWNRFYHVWITRCDTGVFVDHSDQTLDSGDFHFTTCRIQHCTANGMKIAKLGGLALCDTKFQFNDIGLLLEPKDNTAQANPIQGTYITGCQFEDNTTWDIKLSALAGVGANHYPRWTQIVGGTAHDILLNKCDHTSIHGLLSNASLQIDGTATQTEIIGSPVISLAGAGTDYVIMGNSSSDGPFIKTGGKLKVVDAYGNAFIGSYLTSVSSAPNYIGQRALVGTTWYYAVGTSSPSDWVPGGGGGVDGGLFTDTYTISGVDGGSF